MMKIEFHPEILEAQRYSCNCCGRGCRSFLVPVTQKEREAIEALAPWRKRLGVPDLFVKDRAAGPDRYGLVKRPDGACVFLDGDNLCLIHKEHGLAAKPIACQLYPFVFNPFGEELRVGLRFDCPAVCESTGKSLTAYREELRQLARKLVPEEGGEQPIPELYKGQKVSAAWLDCINEAMVSILCSDAQDLVLRLHWLRRFLEYIQKVNWQKVGEDEFAELIAMFKGGILAELQTQTIPRQAVTGKPRKMLGQIFFLLTQPTTIIHADKGSLLGRLRKRLESAGQMKQLAAAGGPLPRIQPDWPDCDLRELEQSFGPWPPAVQEMIGRYLLTRVASLGYCGPNFYQYPLVEGAQSLLLAAVTLGWVMRIQAVRQGRDYLELPDAQQAVMAIDGNLGYSTALGMGPARLRLRYLADHLERFIQWYCT